MVSDGLPTSSVAQQQELINQIATRIASDAREPWDAIVYTAKVLVGNEQHLSCVTLATGEIVRSSPSDEIFDLVAQLREVMYRPNTGTWFSFTLTIRSIEGVDAVFDFDNEPEWSHPVQPMLYVQDLERFPRGHPHIPRWLTEKLLHGRDEGAKRDETGGLRQSVSHVIRPRDQVLHYETASEKKFRAEMRADGFSDDEVNEVIAESRPAKSSFQIASDAAATGRLGYGLGFLAWVPIPFFNLIIAGIVMAAVYPRQRRRSPLAAENARQAANWGLTLIAGILVMGALTFVFIYLWANGEYGPLVALPLVLFPVLGIAHLVVLIVGLVKSTRGEVFRNPIAIPFLR